MKTPMQELFYRIEQLRFAKNPIDELMMIKLQMLEKEKEIITDAYDAGLFDGSMDDVDDRMYKDYYNKTFNTKDQ